MASADLPTLPAASIYCSVAAAARYNIPAAMMLAVAEQEGGRPGLWRANANGTSDVGPMQFNTAYLKTLSKYGIGPGAVAMNGCYSFDLAAWRIKRHLVLDQGDLWQRAANYHSRTPRYNARYRLMLISRGSYWADWLLRCPAISCLSPQSPVVSGGGSQQGISSTRSLLAAGYVPRSISPSANR
jgi:hypothetical protein